MKDLQKKNILVIGDVMLDVYERGIVKRISPEAPVPVFLKQPELTTSVLGGASNVAVNLVAAGQKVSIMSIVGRDPAGKKIKGMLAEYKIDTDLVCDLDRITTVKTRLLAANNQQVLRVDAEKTTNISLDEENLLLNKLARVIDEFDIIVLSDYLKGLLTIRLTQEIIHLANSNNIAVLVDVKDPNAEKYKDAYLLKPNLKELHDLTGLEVNNNNDVVIASRKLLELCHCQYVLTTLGANGMTLVSQSDAYSIRSVKQEVFDVTGAGDTTIAYLAACLANDYSIKDAMKISNYAAGVQVSKVGTSSVSWPEVMNLIRTLKGNKTTKYISSEELKNFRQEHANQCVVFTNGCFDILHAGHVSYLKQAAALGDVLVVGINSDDSVRRLKGTDRPVNNVNDRVAVLGALECVDYITVFEEDTPYNLISIVKPDIIVKGGDYKPDDVVGKDIVEAYGGRVEILPFVNGKSTTNIINKIRG